jgi:hypothetical protein
MSYFGIPLRNGLPLGLGAVASLASLAPAAAPPPPPSNITVLNSTGTSYSVPLAILTSTGASYTVTDSVLSSNGTAYTV